MKVTDFSLEGLADALPMVTGLEEEESAMCRHIGCLVDIPPHGRLALRGNDHDGMRGLVEAYRFILSAYLSPISQRGRDDDEDPLRFSYLFACLEL